MEVQKSHTAETETFIPDCIQQIRTAFKNANSLDVPVQCNEFIARCLRQKDGNVEKAIKLIQAFYAATEDVKDWGVPLLPSLHADFYKTEMVTQLLTRDGEGRRILVVRLELWDPKVTSFDTVVACAWMGLQVVTAYNLDAQRDGFVTIWDYTNFTLEQAWAINHRKMIAMGKWAQNGVVGRLKGLHIINYPRVVDMIYAALKPFLKEKLKKRLHFHENNDSLLKHFPANSLPTYLGGTVDPDLCVDRTLVIPNQDGYFQDMMNYRIPTK